MVPERTPLTEPDAGSTVAIEELLLLHSPPIGTSLKVVAIVGQTFVVPMIPAIAALTVTVVMDMQPPPNEYVMGAVPTEKPETKPVEGLIVATDELALDHVPLPASDNVVVPFAQIVVFPLIAPGTENTATVAVAAQPDDNV